MPQISVFAALALALACSGCFKARDCAQSEICNGRDDDCDRRVDEDFRDAEGRYVRKEHCGGCSVDCAAVFPSAAETECQIDANTAAPYCAIRSCSEGFRLSGAVCVPLVTALCLPCEGDEDCAQRQPGARCLPTTEGGRVCAQPCSVDGECPAGFSCGGPGAESNGQCVARSGRCSCLPETVGASFACSVQSPSGQQCAGVQRCEASGLSACEAALREACNEVDDDCDGKVDEDFRDAQQRYVSAEHCGACARPCVPPGPNMQAECRVEGSEIRCASDCLPGYVDVDDLLANGCECQRYDGQGPPPVIGGDNDCDGIPDDNREDFIFVTSTGNDNDPGTLLRPMRTPQAALQRGRAVGKDVLVARGIYPGPVDLVAGVSIYGGYRPDFRQRDLTLFPVQIEARQATPGSPVLRCRGIEQATRIDGLTLMGSPASSLGEGSTTAYFDGCGPAVALHSITIFAGRGAAGVRGRDSNENLSSLGLSRLEELDGVSGGNGQPVPSEACLPLAGGSGGQKSCPQQDVSGGGGGGAICPNLSCQVGQPCGNSGCADFSSGGVCDIASVMSLALPNPAAQAGRGALPGTAGAPSYNAPTTSGRCVCNAAGVTQGCFCEDNGSLNRDGALGGDGAPGLSGLGGQGCAEAPRFDAATGRLSGGGGGNGSAGANGSGGGGGSAGSGLAVIAGTVGGCPSRTGGSGGGGGSGGCGAPGANGGGGAGSSVGIVIRLGNGQSQGPSLSEVRVVTASGGRGGDGGVGAAGGVGGSGGLGGTATRFFCTRAGGRGGDGGPGGSGGGGGGGCGGSSHGIYLLSGSAALDAYVEALRAGTRIESTGVAGEGGRGGFSPGAPGVAGSPGRSDPIRVVGP